MTLHYHFLNGNQNMPKCSWFGYIRGEITKKADKVKMSMFAICLVSGKWVKMKHKLWSSKKSIHTIISPVSKCDDSSLARWRHMILMSWTSMAGCGCRSACSWWGRRLALRGRSHPSAGPSCSCMAMLTSSAISEAPSWCTRKLRAQTRKSR